MPSVWVAIKRFNFFLIIAFESQKTGGALNGIPVVVAMSRIFE